MAFAEFGDPSGTPVITCRGGPGSTLSPKRNAKRAAAAGFRLIGIDRPGYGESSAFPGRTIADWSKDALAVADYLGLKHFFVEGTSTGGSYCLATASAVPHRVLGVLLCCGMTDMSWAKEVAEASIEGALAIWQSADRDAVIAVAIEQFGHHGEKRFIPDPDAPFRESPPDIEVVRDSAYLSLDPDNTPSKQSVVGHADDRIADGPALNA